MTEPRKLTPKQVRFLEALSSGLPVPKVDLRPLLDDDLSGDGAIAKTICELRKIIPNGHIIVCELVNRRICYRWAIQLMSHSSPRAA